MMNNTVNINKKTISVLGSTGSVGTQIIDVASHLGYNIDMLSGFSNVSLLESQSRKFKVKSVWVSEKCYTDLKKRLSDTETKVYSGNDTLCELAANTNCDMLCNSMLGISGLAPTLAALDGKHGISLANKETLVEGGSIVMKKAAERNKTILPIDSEHSAIFQCLNGKKPKKILLTASGGSFFGKKRDFLEKVTPEMATHHPNWNMGKKITVDSSSLMNKGLELIEAVWLFDVKPEQIEVIIHRESIIHSMVEFCDNTVIAQLAKPDMRLCAQYALTYPERYESLTGSLDFSGLSGLTFSKPDEETFTLLPLARKAISKGGNIPAAMSSANEEAVALFLENKIKFTDIFDYVERATFDVPFIENPDTDDIFETDKNARELIKNYALK